MRTFMTFFAAGLMFLSTSTAFGIGNTMMSEGHAYMTPGPRATVRYAPTYRAAAPVAEGRRSLSVEPGTGAVAPAAVLAPAVRVVRPHPPTWLLPKTDAHRYVTGY
ncbi:MAG: hypothetical protein JNL96_11270 [Planctomycetaceae bacterium]|nr:hypothetical protein [Planctomycetaceae bacterium]